MAQYEDTLVKVCKVLETMIVHAQVDEEMPLVSSGRIDSLSFVQLVVEIEKAVGISIKDEDMTPENFETAKAIATMCLARAA